MIYLSIILIAIIIYLIANFFYYEKIYKKYDIYREIPEVEPSVAGYLYKKSADMFSLILSELLHLVKKGYLKLEYTKDEKGKDDYIFSKAKDNFDDLNRCEMIAYNTIFSYGDEPVSLNTLASKIKDDAKSSADARVSGYAMIRSIKEQIEEERNSRYSSK